jgi:hypothetical protein
LNRGNIARKTKGLKFTVGVPDSYRETSHIHMIIGSKKDKLEDIVRDMKKHTSLELKGAIKNNNQESRKEWLVFPSRVSTSSLAATQDTAAI